MVSILFLGLHIKDMQENLLSFCIDKNDINKNPKYNIVYKHHPNFPKDTKLDKEENLILKDYLLKIIKSPKIEVDT